MFRLFLAVLLCLVFGSSSDDSSYWPQVSKIEVTVMSPCCSLSESEIKKTIYRYGNRQGITSDDMKIRLVEKCNGGDYNYKTIGKFEVHIPQCNEFRKYLLHAGKFVHHMRMVHVKCDRTHYAHCLGFLCKEKDYVDLAKCAYNNTI